jgi:predicted nucleic acid-binding protein
MSVADENARHFVIDASITMAWAFEEEETEDTRAVLKRLEYENAVVPAIWPLEVANVLLVGERRGRLSQAKVSAFTTELAAAPIYVELDTPHRAFQDILTLARQYKLSSYDACYLELALRQALPLATLDKGLTAAANATGVKVI